MLYQAQLVIIKRNAQLDRNEKINYKYPKQKTKQSKAKIMKTMFLANEFKKKKNLRQNQAELTSKLSLIKKLKISNMPHNVEMVRCTYSATRC